ncbi:PilC/PilY family type IV pilus protein [Desulfosediminicola ganghwensis]|uniref:PilC/PilY family type IV pilus protein n=1 Tax=Desulfosediminicola ganghwensis TaxID=2569540 RepID=UPI0010AD0ABD|nr:PilC/PilY family type IV pilus protein [Desulfosediminicola ganghwensis]
MNHLFRRKAAACHLLLLASITFTPLSLNASVCGDGLGMPPFLSSGAKPNLMLAIDNSGSMLDLAYVNNVGECYDNGFDATQTYTGLYEPNTWYEYVPGQPHWVSGTSYTENDIVYSDGAFFIANLVHKDPDTGLPLPSTGISISEDGSVYWLPLHSIADWENGTSYDNGSFVRYEDQLYYTTNGGTANGTTIADDTGVTWEPRDHTWLPQTPYLANDIVSYNGKLYRATSGGTSSATSLHDDSGLTWDRLSEGHFEETNFASINEATTHFSTSAGNAYSNAHLLVHITEVEDTETSTLHQSGVTAFTATGNFLNWASSSKFDIQKKILTGGKFDQDEEFLVSEGRGCSSRGFLKEIPVTGPAGTNSVITFSISGFNDDSWIDTTDDTTRIAILGISAKGFIGSERQQACKNAVDEISKGADASQGQTSQYIDTCLAYDSQNGILAASNAAYNHSIHACWSAVKKGYTAPSDFGNLSEIYNACDGIYANGVTPPTISHSDSGYMCYGVYNESTIDTARKGYVGRCYEPEIGEGCSKKACTSSDDNVDGNPAIKCFENVLYECTGNYQANKDACNKEWAVIWVDDSGNSCTPTSSQPAQWTDDFNPNSADECVQEAMWDYCQSITLPEVIDPSDEIFNSGETWGLPGSLVDSGVIAMFGTDSPLIVMKGYLKTTEKPEGLLHEVAGDLRLGAMAFADNGALTECEIANNAISTDPNKLTDPIIKYCPAENRDGAEIIARISDGDTISISTGNKHVEDLSTAINNIKATAWTPLAEGIYNALGYYGQNDSFRLDARDFLLETEDSAWEDPVQYWCQENYVLFITEGASTADIHNDVAGLVNTMPATFANAGYSVANDGECTSGQLYGSTYLDDVVYYGKNAPVTSLYTTPAESPGQLASDDGILYDKRNVTSYFVVAGVPRDDDSKNDCNPAVLMQKAADNAGTTLYTGEDPGMLESNLRTALSDILFRASAGSAASVISSSRSGEGGVYQAIFWPKIDRGIGKEPLVWVGDVHAFFIDSKGNLWDDYSGNSTTQGELWTEDTNGNGKIDTGEDSNNNGVLDGDRRVVTYFDETSHSTKICFNRDVIDTGVCSQSDYFQTNDTSIDLRDFKHYLWSAKDRLAAIPDSNILENREFLPDGTWDFTGGYPYRYVFTWNDINNDGIVDNYEVLSFDRDTIKRAESDWLEWYTTHKGRGSLQSDFGVTSVEELQDVVAWVRGYDEYVELADGTYETKYRCRQYPDCDYTTLNRETWRLGDVIHSTPTLVGRPSEGYHYIYNDPDYADFYKKYNNRRHMIYFGANDGMLHAVNGGFYDSGLNRFLPCRPDSDQRNSSGECIATTAYGSNSTTAYPELGDEMWAYVPYNLQPHLQCLTSPEYEHKYYVDAPPRIFDVRIFPDDDIHPNGWGTILVGHMRFGGAPQIADNSTVIDENREFVSAYFVLDITDPERQPTLLGEMTMTTEKLADSTDKYAQLGFTTAMPSIVVMRDDSGNSEWFLVLGNGPTTIKGQNDQQGKIAIYPLNALTGVNWKTGNGTVVPSSIKPFRIPNALPSSSATIPYAGRFLIDADSSGGIESFVGDIVTVDYDLSSNGSTGKGIAYKSDAAYFGTTDGSDFTGTKPTWNGGGRLFRLVTKSFDTVTGKQAYTYPDQWEIKKLIDTEAPITAAPNIGFDPENFWIYFGTGRFYSPEDKSDATTQRFFGIREPRDQNCDMTWGEVNWLNNGSAIAPNPAAIQGDQGLYRSDLMKVLLSGTGGFYGKSSLIYCENEDGTTCIPPGLSKTYSLNGSSKTYYSYGEMEQYIRGERCGGTNNDSIGIDGWYRELTEPRERSLGMPTLLGGLTTFTTYQPFADICQAEGVSSLYGVYYLTGTAWYENVFGTDSDQESNDVVRDKLDLGRGQAMTPSLHVGSGGDDANAYIQTSTGEIIQVGQQNLPLNNFKSGRSTWTDQ